MANETIEVLRIPGTLFPRGPFDENADYKFLNFVESGGNGYVCLQPCTGIPVTNTAYWFKFVFKGEKGDAFTYADLTAEQKAELVRDATAAAQAAASSAQSAADDAAAVLQKFNTIKAAIDAIDPTSAEGSIQTLAAKQGLLEAGLDELGLELREVSPQVNGLAPLTAYTGRLESTSASISNVSGNQYYVVAVKPNDTVLLNKGTGSTFFYEVKEFTFNPTLPYSLVLATGETGRHLASGGMFTMASDAAYIVLRGTVTSLEINGRDVMLPLEQIDVQLKGSIDGVSNDVIKVSNDFNFTFNGAAATELKIRVYDGGSKIFVASDNERHYAIPCAGGDIIEIERNDTSATSLRFLKSLIPAPVDQPLVYSEASGYTSVKSISTVGYHYKFTVPDDVTYILVQVRSSSSETNNLLPKLLVLNGDDLFKTYTERADEKVQYGTDLSSQVTEMGYHSLSGNGAVISSDAWMHYLLRISPGDRVVTNYNHNASHTYAGNCLFAEDMVTPVRIFNCTDDYTVTLQDWNDGARYYGVSFRLAEPSVNNQPYLYLTRNFGKSAMFTANDLLDKSLIQKDKVVLKLENTYNFDVHVYDNNGRKTTHNFIRYYKMWDSLTYTDADNIEQTATNVVSGDVWSNNVITYGSKYLCQGNNNFIISPLAPWGAGSHLSNEHGCEVMKYLALMIDGKEIEPEVSTAEYEGKEFKMILFSHIYASGGGGNTVSAQKPLLDTDGNPVVLFKRTMQMTITADNDVFVENKLEICQDNVSFLSCDAAMMECNYGDFDRVVIGGGKGGTYISSISDSGVATPLADTDAIPNDGLHGVFASKVEMYGKGFYVTQEIEPKMENAVPNVFPYFYSDRLKCYLYPVLCQRSPEGTTPQVFNTGDVIVTRNTRHIRLSDEIDE